MLGRQRVYWMVVANSQQWTDIDDFDCKRFAAVGGHHPVVLFDRIARPKVFMAVIRDPIQRAISLFHYIVEGSPRPHPLRPELRSLTVPQALERSAQFRHLVTDAQCLMIGGARHYDAALQSLCERVWFVDITERIDPLFARVCRKLGWPHRALLRENAGPSGYAEAYACDATIDALQQLNKNDMRLYRMFADCADQFDNGRRWRQANPRRPAVTQPGGSWILPASSAFGSRRHTSMRPRRRPAALALLCGLAIRIGHRVAGHCSRRGDARAGTGLLLRLVWQSGFHWAVAALEGRRSGRPADCQRGAFPELGAYDSHDPRSSSAM